MVNVFVKVDLSLIQLKNVLKFVAMDWNKVWNVMMAIKLMGMDAARHVHLNQGLTVKAHQQLAKVM